MAKYSAQLKATNNQGKTVTTSISNINPEANSETIIAFSQRLNALTTNTYDSTDYIVTTNLDNDDDTRLDTTFTITSENFLTNMSTGGKSSTYTTNSDGEVSIAINGNHGILAGLVTNSGTAYLNTSLTGSTQSAGTLTIRVTGTSTYKPFEQTYDFT